MTWKGFDHDDGGRVPFALVALVLLMGVSVIGALVANLGPPDRAESCIERDLNDLRSFEDGMVHLVVVSATDALDVGLEEGRDLDWMAERLESSVRDGLDQISIEGRSEDWTLGLDVLDIGIDLGVHVPEGRVIGKVDWTAENREGRSYGRVTELDEPLDRPYGLVHHIRNRLEVSGDESGELAGLVRYILYKLGFVRAANGVLDGRKVITEKDVGLAMDLAIELLLNSSVNRSLRPIPMNGTMDGGHVDLGKDPADMFLELRDETTVRSSSIMAQYIVGLLDYYLLWFRDYSGLGEGVESFFEWVGVALTDEDLDDVDAWWEGFKVGDAVERWVYRILARSLHHIMEMQGNEDIDVTGIGIDELRDRARGTLDGPIALDEMESKMKDDIPEDIVTAMDRLPVEDVDGPDLLDMVKGRVLGTVMSIMDVLFEVAREMALSSLDDLATVDRLHHISTRMPKDLIGAGPGNGSGNGSGSEDLDLGRFEVTGLYLERTDIHHSATIATRGVHHVAPEERVSKAVDALFHPGQGRALKEVRPYETDYDISIIGEMTVERYIFRTRSLSTMIEDVGPINVTTVVPINITITVPVFTGLPLYGIDYDPSDTLAGDLEELVWWFVNSTWAGLQWAAGAMSDLFSGLMEALRELGHDGLENLGKMSAATFSRTMEKLMKSLYNKAWNDAMNITWALLRKLIGDELRDMLTFRVDLFGLNLMVELDVFKETLTVSHISTDHGFSLVVKRLAEENPPFRPRPVEGFTYSLIGLGYVHRGKLSVEVTLDPLTIMFPAVVHVFGESRDADGKGYRFEISAPIAYRSYDTKEISISSVTGSAITGIPIPGTGLTMDIDAGLRVSYGKGIKSPDKLLIRALRKAWYDTLKGYTVKELYGDWGDPELMEAFLVQLLNNIVNSIGDTISKELPELEVFVEGKISTLAGGPAGGFTLSFVIKDPVRVLWELGPWLMDNIRAFLLKMGLPGLPVGLVGIPSFVMEHLFVRSLVYTEVGAPDILGGEGTGKVTMGGMVEVNLPALTALVGQDKGRWMVRGGVVLPGLPSTVASMIPGFRAPRPTCDLWFVEIKVMELDNDRAKISEVYYDTSGRDSEEEFIEIWNPTDRRIDLSRWTVEDNGGRWRLPDHLTLGPGRRMVVARNRDGFREIFDDLPDVSGLPLSLNNDGDVIALVDPYGVEIDMVSWEDWVHGWDVVCESGESLHRGSVDTNSPKDWYCAKPDPGH